MAEGGVDERSSGGPEPLEPPGPEGGAEALQEVLPALVQGDQDDEAGVLLCRGRGDGDGEKKAGNGSSDHVYVSGMYA